MVGEIVASQREKTPPGASAGASSELQWSPTDFPEAYLRLRRPSHDRAAERIVDALTARVYGYTYAAKLGASETVIP
jgi:hypothetical protein